MTFPTGLTTTETTTTMTVSCDDCVMRGTDVCAGCVLTFLCEDGPRDPRRRDAVTIDSGEIRAVAMLGRAGLTPPLRHRRPGQPVS